MHTQSKLADPSGFEGGSDAQASRRRRHDLCNQLYLIISFTDLIRIGKAGPVSAQQAEFLGHVLDCAEQIRKLIFEPTATGPGAAGKGLSIDEVSE